MPDIEDNNTNVLGIQTVADELLSDNEVLSDNVLTDNSDNSVDNSTNTDVDADVKVEDVANDKSDNSTNTDVDLEVEVEDSLNDNSVDNSVDTDTEIDTEIEVEDSFNVETEVEDSYNTEDESIRNQDSFNITSSFNTQTLNDHSTTIGVRQYNAGGDISFAGMGGMFAAAGLGGGDIDIDARSMQLDQSVNQIISTDAGNGGGDVTQTFAQAATTAFGDDAVAAGGDATVYEVDVDLKIGDINIGNTAIDTEINDSFNDYSQEYELEIETEIEDSFNDQSTDVDIDTEFEDSFNDESTEIDTEFEDSFNDQSTDVDVEVEDSFTSEIDSTVENELEWENSGNLFSPHSIAGGEAEIDL